jgi:3-deoxy-D-manno-octulosonic-acid transferase
VGKRPLIWMHAPSVGEGLQAKPVLETLRAEHPDWQLAFTFFSPSAERLAKNLPVDIADYLPLDRPSEVSKVLDALQPTALVFSKLDVWPELTLAAASRGVKLGLISATVAPNSSRLRWPARQWSAPAYRALDRVGTISEDDGERLEILGARRRYRRHRRHALRQRGRARGAAGPRARAARATGVDRSRRVHDRRGINVAVG